MLKLALNVLGDEGILMDSEDEWAWLAALAWGFRTLLSRGECDLTARRTCSLHSDSCSHTSSTNSCLNSSSDCGTGLLGRKLNACGCLRNTSKTNSHSVSLLFRLISGGCRVAGGGLLLLLLPPPFPPPPTALATLGDGDSDEVVVVVWPWS